MIAERRVGLGIKQLQLPIGHHLGLLKAENLFKLVRFVFWCRNSSKKALTNDLIEGLEKDLERLKRFEENLRIRKLRTMKGGDKIINETDEDRHNAGIAALQADVRG